MASKYLTNSFFSNLFLSKKMDIICAKIYLFCEFPYDLDRPFNNINSHRFRAIIDTAIDWKI